MTLPAYLAALDKQYRTGIAREHAYRSDLQQLLSALCPGVLVINEPARIACGAPDYILTSKDIPVGYVEAKDIGVDLGSKSLKEQFDRYRGSLDNLIITDYLEFRFFRSGEPTATVRVGEVGNGRIRALPENFGSFTALITDFAAWQGQTITSPKKLASMMAGKARLLADVIAAAVSSDAQSQANTDLKEQLDAFKNILIHDITPKAFADLYAQTITYGMFAARLHDPTLDSFSRMEAAQLIPKSNPFLRKLFQNISGYDLDERIVWIVDALADVFRATDIAKLLSGFGLSSGREDAFMHFYEDFLAQYDPKLRKSRGVWYTPDAVVRFIVRAVDDILKTEFGLPMGLADESTVELKRTVHTKATPDRRSRGKDIRYKETVHRVQVLDPATGTGTFLAEVVRQVYAKFGGQQGMWPQYVEQHLIPRLNGFELLMASYAMAHLKLDLVLRSTGYDMGKPHSLPGTGSAKDQQRLRIFLTNSLEEAHPDTGTLFANWLSQEANEANAVKRETPVMVVLGNPPYRGISSNMGEWVSGLIGEYKYVDGQHFGERKHWLHDDYVKFIRFGEYFIERTGQGVLAYINNHSFLDNPTFRGMRWHLLNTFDKIYVIDLHGNTKKKEVAPDGRKDENVFDIQQGVSINLFLRTATKKKGDLAKVYYSDMWGPREFKYDELASQTLGKVKFDEVQPAAPGYVMRPKNDNSLAAYVKGFAVQDLFAEGSVGFVSGRDAINIAFSADQIERNMQVLQDRSVDEIRAHFRLTKDARDWAVPTAKKDVMDTFESAKIIVCSYRAFDTRFTFYSGNSRGIYASPQQKVMRQFIGRKNVGFVTVRRQVPQNPVSYYFMTDKPISNGYIRSDSVSIDSVFPLFIYPAPSDQTSTNATGVQANLDPELVQQLARGIGLTYTFKPDALFAHGTHEELTPLDVLDYCYAVLHSPAYRATFKEFLKSDFPRAPFPADATKFRALVQLGAELRALHLLEWHGIDAYITNYPVGGSNELTRKISARSPGWEPTSEGMGRVWINDTQYFDDVPEVAWNFYIGGYQPAQKWLKDRHSRVLTFADIRHYQRMIVALKRTDEVMEEVDRVGVL